MDDLERQLGEWHAKHELRMSLVMNANSAAHHLERLAETGSSRIRSEYAIVYQEHADVYRDIAAQFEEVNDAARMTEIAVWFGRPDLADAVVVEASREFAKNWLPRSGGLEPDFGLIPGSSAVQTYYHNAATTAHSFDTPDFQAMLMGSAGRVLLTIRDTRPEGDPEAKSNGANITLIFDEDSKHPRGGIQSLIGTKDECLNLLKALRDAYPFAFSPDNNLSIF